MNNDPQIPEVELHVTAKRLSPSQGLANSVVVDIETKSDEILVDSITGQQTRTGRYTTLPPPLLINFSLRSSSHHHIRSHLHDQLGSLSWFCDELASEISTAAIILGFGYNGFTLSIHVIITYQTFLVKPVSSSSSNNEGVLRMILLGRINAEELKSLDMETESCSICLENLSGSKPNVLTRMTCSHVFHNLCLVEWLYRKNTCPLCRTVLYDR